MKVVYWSAATFQNDVEEFCKRQGWSRHRLAREAGLPHSAVYSWLNGSRGLSLDATCAVAHVCDLTLDRYVRSPG